MTNPLTLVKVAEGESYNVNVKSLTQEFARKPSPPAPRLDEVHPPKLKFYRQVYSGAGGIKIDSRS